MIKTKQEVLSPEDYLATIEHPTRQADGLVLLDWFKQTTDFPAVMWGNSMIGYGRYHYDYASGHSGDSFITGFSPRKAALSVYIMPGYQDMSEHLQRLGKHKIGKSCLYINKLDDIDMGVLADMVQEGVKYIRAHYSTWER